MSILEAYKEQIEQDNATNSCVDAITLYVLISATKNITEKEELISYLEDLEMNKLKELIAHNKSFNLRRPYALEKEITTIKFLIASVKM